MYIYTFQGWLFPSLRPRPLHNKSRSAEHEDAPCTKKATSLWVVVSSYHLVPTSMASTLRASTVTLCLLTRIVAWTVAAGGANATAAGRVADIHIHT